MSQPNGDDHIQAGTIFMHGNLESHNSWAATYQSDIGNLVMAAAISFGPDKETAQLSTPELLKRMDTLLMQQVFSTPQSISVVSGLTQEFANTIVSWHGEGMNPSVKGVSVVATNGDIAVASYAGEGTLAISRSRESPRIYAYTNPRRFGNSLRALDKPLSFDLEGKESTILVSSGIARAREMLSRDPRVALAQVQGTPGAFIAIHRA